MGLNLLAEKIMEIIKVISDLIDEQRIKSSV